MKLLEAVLNRIMAVKNPSLHIDALVQHYKSLRKSFKKISQDPKEFIRIMKKMIPDLIVKIEERPPGSKSGISQFYTKLNQATMNLIHVAHEAGIIPTVYYMHWGLQIQNAVHPGNPFETKVKELGNKVEEFEKKQEA